MPAPRPLLSREAQLLLLTAAGPSNDAPLRRLLASELDWGTLGALARAEQATLIVWQRLQRLRADRLPLEIATAWRKLAMVSEFDSLRLEQRLREAVGALATRGIEVMLLKGSALAYTTYSSFADRPMGDIDLLVRPEHAREAWSVLQTSGWSPSTQWPAEWYTGHQHLPPLVDLQAERFRLELHTELFPSGHPFRLSADALWPGAKTVRLDRHTVRVADSVQQLLYLCIHFAWLHMMQWGSWRTFRDVEATTGRADMPWERLVDLARESRATTCCFWTLRLARNLVGVQVPDDVLRALRPPLPEFFLDGCERHYALQLFPTESRCPSVWLSRRLWELGIAPRWSGHGSSRPWQIAWVEGANQASDSDPWPRRFLRHLSRVGVSMGYLGRITP